MTTAPRSDLTFSQNALRRRAGSRPASPLRTRATTLSGFGGLRLGAAKGGASGGSERAVSERSQTPAPWQGFQWRDERRKTRDEGRGTSSHEKNRARVTRGPDSEFTH